MMTKPQIEASIAALQPAPAGETLERVAVRAAHWLLNVIEDEHSEIAVTRGLYARAIAGDRPTEAEWQANIDALARALDRALAIARSLARAANALDLVRSLELASASSRAIDLASATHKLLGDRVTPIERLDAAILAAIGPNAEHLDMGAWHCGTTHCRAGWAITLHPMGRELESIFGSWLAGAVIYIASTGSVPDFFASNASALADMRRAAEAGDEHYCSSECEAFQKPPSSEPSP